MFFAGMLLQSLLRLTWINAQRVELDDHGGMSSALCSATRLPTRSRWRDVVMPKEHGSWSLAFEPVAFGLLLAPSVAGFCLSAAALAGFLARRPMKLMLSERPGERRDNAITALAVLALIAVAGLIAAIQTGESGWLVWLLPSVLAGGVFLFFDLKNSGREGVAEIAGATAFASVSAAIVAAAGWAPPATFGVLFVMAARAVPTVMFVRAYVRGAKTCIHQPYPALTAAALAVFGAVALWASDLVPGAAIVALALLFLRAATYLAYPCPRIRPRTIGFQELALGVSYISATALAWHF